MKRSAVFLIAIVLGPSSALAQIDPGSNVLTANANYVTAKVEGFSGAFNGWGLGVTFEKVLGNAHWSLGANLSYFSTDGFSEEGIRSTFNGVPILLTGRYYIGSQRILGYIGLGVGVQFGTLETSGPVFSRSNTSDFAAGIPLGVLLGVARSAFVNLNWTPYFVPDSRLADGFANIINVGLTFTFSG